MPGAGRAGERPRSRGKEVGATPIGETGEERSASMLQVQSPSRSAESCRDCQGPWM